MKKLLAILLTFSMILSVQVFADTSTSTQTTTPAEQSTTTTTPGEQTTTTTTTNTDITTTQNPGITPDSILYALDKLFEKIQLTIITDAVKEAELLAQIAQERLAESNAMADKADLELTEKALSEYQANLEKAVNLIETAMADGKEVAKIMEGINEANLKDAAVVEKILASIPEEFRAEVKTGIEQLASVTEAANETAQAVETDEEEGNSLKLEITLKLIEEKVQDPALIAKINEAGLNSRQVISLLSLAEQAEKPLAEVLDIFINNEKGIGATAKELGINTKDALKGINSSFKETKKTIKEAFKEAIKTVDDVEKDEAEDIVNSSLSGQEDAKNAAMEAANKLEKLVKAAKTQIEEITDDNNSEAKREAINNDSDDADENNNDAIEENDKDDADKNDKAVINKNDKDDENDKNDKNNKDKKVKEN